MFHLTNWFYGSLTHLDEWKITNFHYKAIVKSRMGFSDISDVVYYAGGLLQRQKLEFHRNVLVLIIGVFHHSSYKGY